MPCCAAINCSNRTEKKVHLYRFPRDDHRRDKWVQNMRRGGNWQPSTSSRLCEVHFENSQFERHRVDEKKKLMPNAVPTLFDVPNLPPMINPPARRSKYKKVKKSAPGTEMDVENKNMPNQNDNPGPQNSEASILKNTNTIEELKVENQMLRKELERSQTANNVLQNEIKLLREKLTKTQNTLLSQLIEDQKLVFVL